MKLITGHTGEPHVYAVDDAAVHKLMVGDGDYVLPYGSKLALTQVDAHAVSVSDGYLMTQGRLGCVRTGEEETISFDGGVNGYYTPYVIAAQYSVDDNIEKMDLVVLEGAKSTTSDVTFPSLRTGNIDNGETHQMGLWRIVLNGMAISTMERYTVPLSINPISDIYAEIGQIRSQVDASIAEIRSTSQSAISSVRTTAENTIQGWKPFYYQKGDTFNPANGAYGIACSGLLSSSSKQLVFTVPTKPIVSNNSDITLNALYMTIRIPGGGYPYIRSGNTYTDTWSMDRVYYSGGSARVAGISNVYATNHGGAVRVVVELSTALVPPNKKGSVANNSPISVYLGGKSTFTVK